MMQYKMAKIIFTFCVCLISSNVYSSLIVNGGFEDTKVKKGNWKWFKASRVNGWMGSNIEIWNNLGGLEAAEGSQHIELNSHGHNSGAFSIYQDFSTIIGQSYSLNFYYRARRNDKEAFKVELLSQSNDIFSTHIFDDHRVGIWTSYSGSFKSVSNRVRLQFTSITPVSSTTGNLIDNISVSPQQLSTITSVAEPSTFVLVTFSVLGLFFTAKRNN